MSTTADTSQLNLTLDRTKFPMLWIDAIDAYMSWVPITKVQFEYFLCDRPEPRFNEKWYDEVLARNARVSPGKIRHNDYWRALITGVTPDDAKAFAEWCGHDSDETYELPTRKEWFDAYQALRVQEALPFSVLATLELTRRAETLLQKLDAAAEKFQSQGTQKESQRSLADSMLMHDGVFEWVIDEENRWGGAARPHPELGGGLINLDGGRPKYPTQVDPPPQYYGFRLIKRDV